MKCRLCKQEYTPMEDSALAALPEGKENAISYNDWRKAAFPDREVSKNSFSGAIDRMRRKYTKQWYWGRMHMPASTQTRGQHPYLFWKERR